MSLRVSLRCAAAAAGRDGGLPEAPSGACCQQCHAAPRLCRHACCLAASWRCMCGAGVLHQHLAAVLPITGLHCCRLSRPHRCYVFGADERAALAHKASSYCAKLLKRTDQCQALLACSHLHWQPAIEGKRAVRDEQAVLSCLKRALKVANAAQQQLAVAGKPARGGDVSSGPAAAASLFVEILNHYLFFFDAGGQLITTAVLQASGQACGAAAAYRSVALHATECGWWDSGVWLVWLRLAGKRLANCHLCCPIVVLCAVSAGAGGKRSSCRCLQRQRSVADVLQQYSGAHQAAEGCGRRSGSQV